MLSFQTVSAAGPSGAGAGESDLPATKRGHGLGLGSVDCKNPRLWDCEYEVRKQEIRTSLCRRARTPGIRYQRSGVLWFKVLRHLLSSSAEVSLAWRLRSANSFFVLRRVHEALQTKGIAVRSAS